MIPHTVTSYVSGSVTNEGGLANALTDC